jgi:Uma2 family endonuclease
VLRSADGRSITDTPGHDRAGRPGEEKFLRIPGLAVTCSPYQEEEYALPDPVLVIEILSRSNQAQTWTNVWAYTTIPSVQEILIVHSTAIRADLLRRDASGNWPEQATTIEDGQLGLRSIDFTVALPAIYLASGW